MKKWELELENKNLQKNCEILMKENKFLKALLHNKDWHYISEEGLPEAGQYYLIAYKGPLGVSASYCKLVNKNVPGMPVYDEKGCLVRMAMDGSFTTKEWDYPVDVETKAWLNENGRVYAWMPLPALPEVNGEKRTSFKFPKGCEQAASELAEAKEIIKGLLNLPDLVEDRISEHIELIGQAEKFVQEVKE